MARCPNCAGELLFDIKTQSLKCQQCDSVFNPYDKDKTVEGVVQEYYDTQVFTCPQCGAEIVRIFPVQAFVPTAVPLWCSPVE